MKISAFKLKTIFFDYSNNKIVATEDELARCAPLERICPTPNSYRYIKFTETPRYYNRLLDAWETRFADARQDAVDLLQKYCENKVHLIAQCTKTNGDDGIKTDEHDGTQNGTVAQCSDNEVDEIFEPSLKAIPQKRMTFVETVEKTTNTTTAVATTKKIDSRESPLTVSDDQLNEPVIDQHDILVSSIA